MLRVDAPRQDFALLVGAVAAAAVTGAVVGIAPNPRPVAMLIVLVGLACGAGWALRKPWGVVVPLAPIFLIPSIPPHFGLTPESQMAAVVAVLTAAWWLAGAGRPPVSWWALSAVGVAFAWTAGVSWRGALDLQDSFALPALWASGIVLGAGIAGNRQALYGVTALVAPAGALALAEAAGMSNFWASATGSSLFLDIASIQGATRSISTFGHPLIAGAMLAVASMLIVRGGRVGLAVAVVGMAGAVATVSRSALLGLAVALVVLLWVDRRHTVRSVLAVAFLVTAGWVAVTYVPAINQSFSERVGQGSEGQVVREYAFDITRDSIANDTAAVAFGGGIGQTNRDLEARGTIHGFVILDNQYATGLFDMGLVPLGLIGALLGAALLRAAPDNRRMAAPALAAVVVTLAFADGLYWTSLGTLSALVVGAATAPRAYRS